MGDRTRLILSLLLGLIAISIANGVELAREVPAKDVLAKIGAGEPAEFDNCVIVGYLNLSALTIERSVHFNDTIFQNSVNFESTIFNGDAYFRASTFNGAAYFGHSTFNGTAYFERSTFNDTAYFLASTFNGAAYFRASTFNDTADFRYSTFNGAVNFVSFFKGFDYFWSTSSGAADFGYSTFNGAADFGHSTINGAADFGHSTFKEDAFFYGTSFNHEINLELTEYKKLYIRWCNNNRLVYDDTAYQLLIDNLKKLGFIGDADVCYYQFRAGQVLHQDPINDPIMYLLNFGSWIFYGFGKKPLYPLIWSVFFIVVFGFLWMSLESNEPERVIKKINAWIKLSYVSIFLFILLNSMYSYRMHEVISPMLLVLLMFFLSTIIIKIRAWVNLSFVLIFFFILLNLTSSYRMQGTFFPIMWALLLILLIIFIVFLITFTAYYDDAPSRWKNLLGSLSFSAAVFLSGTKLFLDPPTMPELPEGSKSLIKKVFLFERMLGALFSILFFLAIGATVVR